MIAKKLHDKVFYYENVIENPKDLIEKIESTEFSEEFFPIFTKWIEWNVDSDRGSYIVYGKKKMCKLNDTSKLRHSDSNIASELVNTDPDIINRAEYIIETINSAMENVCNDYKKQIGINDDVVVLRNVGIHKYKAGTWMGTHYDSQEGDTRLKYSLVLYLNDDYEGGELSFTIKDGVLSNPDNGFPDNPWNHLSILDESGGGKYALDDDLQNPKNKDLIDFYVKPKAGSCIIFPSQEPYSHTAHLVKSGWKYMVPGFWINPDGMDSVSQNSNSNVDYSQL